MKNRYLKFFYTCLVCLIIAFSSTAQTDSPNEPDKEEEKVEKTEKAEKSTTTKKEAEEKKQEDNPYLNNQKRDVTAESMILEVKQIEVKPIQKTTSLGEMPALETEIPEADPKKVIKSWQKLIKNKTKSKVLVSSGEITINNTNLPQIYSEPINIVSSISASEEGTLLQASFLIDGVEVVSEEKHPELMGAAKKFIYNFGIEHYKNAVDEQVKIEEKKQKGYKSKLKKLQNVNERLHKRIGSYKSNIHDKELDIQTNMNDQKAASKSVSEARIEYSKISKNNPEARSMAKKDLRTKKRNLKKLRNKKKEYYKKVASYKAGIEEAKSAIDLNLDQQDIVKKQIKKQAAFINGLIDKRARIK